MVVQVVHTPSATYEVSGNGYVPERRVSQIGRQSATEPKADPELWLASGLHRLQRCCVEVRASKYGCGRPTEGALLSLLSKARLDKSQIEHAPCGQFPSSERKRMSVIAG